MSMAVGGSGKGARAEINVTPLIDVLLVLLIIFLVITPPDFKGLNTLIPQPAPPTAAPAIEESNIVIEVAKDRTLRINTEVVKETDLIARLEEIFKTRVNKVLFVKGDPDVEYAYVAQVVDDAKGANIDRVGFMPH